MQWYMVHKYGSNPVYHKVKLVDAEKQIRMCISAVYQAHWHKGDEWVCYVERGHFGKLQIVHMFGFTDTDNGDRVVFISDRTEILSTFASGVFAAIERFDGEEKQKADELKRTEEAAKLATEEATSVEPSSSF